MVIYELGLEPLDAAVDDDDPAQVQASRRAERTRILPYPQELGAADERLIRVIRALDR
jgi:hypothetical protein